MKFKQVRVMEGDEFGEFKVFKYLLFWKEEKEKE